MAGQTDCCCEYILSDGKLPGDIMVFILTNLPVKSLLKFKSVSKPWYYLISSPCFIKLHLRRQSVIANNLLMWLDDWEDCVFGLLSHNSRDKNMTAESDSDVVILKTPPLLSSKEDSLVIIDSCNGLVCIHSFSFAAGSGCDRLILWNPATRKYRPLELPKGNFRLSYSTLGLCYVEATNDFKLVGWTHIHTPVDRPRLFVYSLSSGCWEDLDCDAKKFAVVFESPIFMSGCMHWLANTCTCSSVTVCTCSFANVITAFNVTDGVMSCFGVPDNCGHRPKTSRVTLVIRGCLSIVVFPKFGMMENEFEVWVMEEYGVEGSWVTRFSIQGVSQQVMEPSISWNDGEIIFIYGSEGSSILRFYDPYSKNEYYLEFKSFYVYKVFNYVESLAAV